MVAHLSHIIHDPLPPLCFQSHVYASLVTIWWFMSVGFAYGCIVFVFRLSASNLPYMS